MSKIVDRQSFLFSFKFNGTVYPSILRTNLFLRFQADELVVKSITYSTDPATNDTVELCQIWCNIVNDNLIGSFPNFAPNTQSPNHHFTMSKFQQGEFVLAFQTSTPSNYYSSQDLLSSLAYTYGTVAIAIEFIKYGNK